jgi:hypothetical protein
MKLSVVEDGLTENCRDLAKIAICAACALFLFVAPVQAQEIADIKKAVTFAFGTIHPRNADGTPIFGPSQKPIELNLALGTSFFVLYPDDRGGPDFAFVYLVTAKHVLKDTDGSYLKEISARMNLNHSSTTQDFDFIQHIPVTDATGTLIWFHDPDDAVDIAALPLLPDQNKFSFKAIPINSFVDDAVLKREHVAEGDLLFFVGLMAQYYGEAKNFPVVRRGALAMMTDEKIETPTGRQRAFIAELTSWPGNSGSPVFLNLSGLRGNTISVGNNLNFLGVLSGSFVNKLKGTVLESQTAVLGNEMNTGISFIIPAERVKAVLESAAAQSHRDAQIQALKNTK